ncbi:MAG: DNA-binding protein [Flexibacter sp. CG_4_10_14_3_um_filter_32_15]|nr:MAG: DNA-binding protein [Flexibacter sp. CG_4_10_14_3_um_filter_32_15]
MSEYFDDEQERNNDYSKPNYHNETIFSKKVRAGKRTYFIDVKPTRSEEEYYITLTESKKVFRRSGGHYFEKHKVFLYKEDLNKILAGLTEVIEHVKNDLMPDYDFTQFDREYDDNYNESFDTESPIKKSPLEDDEVRSHLQWD